MTYAELLQDPRWQKKRLKVFERDDWACQKCGSREKTLHVHHLQYCAGRRPWEYDDDDLQTLCVDCHTDEGITVIGIDGFANQEFGDHYGSVANVYLRLNNGIFKKVKTSDVDTWDEPDPSKPNALVAFYFWDRTPLLDAWNRFVANARATIRETLRARLS